MHKENIVRVAFILSYVANLVLAMLSLVILPDRVAIHFGPGGMPDNWAPSYVNSLLFLGMDTLLFLSLYFSPRLVFIFPASWVNLPNRQFWLDPENRDRAVRKISALMCQFGVAIFLFLFGTQILTIQANLSAPARLNESLLFTFLVLFLGYLTVWCVVFFRSFRLPDKSDLA